MTLLVACHKAHARHTPDKVIHGVELYPTPVLLGNRPRKPPEVKTDRGDIETSRPALAAAMLLRLMLLPIPILYSLSICTSSDVTISRRLRREVRCAHIMTSRCLQQVNSFT